MPIHFRSAEGPSPRCVLLMLYATESEGGRISPSACEFMGFRLFSQPDAPGYAGKTVAAMSSPMASEAVAAGEGAFST